MFQWMMAIVQEIVGLEIIYSSRDSIMIKACNSHWNELNALEGLGEKVKKEVNCWYKMLSRLMASFIPCFFGRNKYAATTVGKG